MQLLIAAVGRLKDDAERVLVDRYAQRIGTGRVGSLGPLKDIEVPESRRATAPERKAEEAERLLKAAANADLRISLDEGGRAMSSEAFARWLGGERDGGARLAAFFIGGPDGHGTDIKQHVRLTLSLGPMTLPHGIARAVLAEQLYRATTILAGHPYHRA
ncbi:MAG: 23S rRNA (pseudouridine(1915)-N(3))-methyltransferase RlmH [Hyphomicrobiaceae bacterium]